MRAGIQADDLTGASDAGAPFAARGLDTVVLLPGAPDPPRAVEVLALDTESRARPRAEAAARARAAAERLAAHRPALLYKKVDSTLRGAVAAELAGVLQGAGGDRALLAPAFPAQGRTVRDGRLLVHGRPAGDGPVARDPQFPPTGDSVLALVATDPAPGLRPVALLPLATVRRGADAVADRLSRFPGILVADAETERDLEGLAAALGGAPALVAGSAGLAAALAAQGVSGYYLYSRLLGRP